MTKELTKRFLFNLWRDPWVQLELPNGEIISAGIEQTLLEASSFKGLYESSPLVVAGIHRLLTAVLQHALSPKSNAEIISVRKAGKFPESAIKEFGTLYAERFDLFSKKAPFMQSADLPLTAGKDAKTVAYLAPEIPAGTEVTHYRHGAQAEQAFCPACAAGCLAAMPAFATSGGSGIKPSINGVPPVYVLPGGETLFESLALSLITPKYFPTTASKSNDLVWWAREPIVKRSDEILEVGYLHSLTFPARRIRLHPLVESISCIRCGAKSEVGVRTMVYEMGECRPKEAEIWLDPFAAYRKPAKAIDKPIPVRPYSGKALWREYASLFLHEPQTAQNEERKMIRPKILEQIAEQDTEMEIQTFQFRCIGMRTDMKAKVFEWIDVGFDLPPALLLDENAGITVQDAVERAKDCAEAASGAFRQAFSSSSRGAERGRPIRIRMLDDYWACLANPFRAFILALGSGKPENEVIENWVLTCIDHALAAYIKVARGVGDDADTLRRSITGERYCRYRLSRLKEKWIPNDQEVSYG
jgi:CRISPR system Cascade subunit CasA